MHYAKTSTNTFLLIHFCIIVKLTFRKKLFKKFANAILIPEFFKHLQTFVTIYNYAFLHAL